MRGQSVSQTPTDAKTIATLEARVHLHAFLNANALLELPRPRCLRVSILLVLYNRAELTLACLRSLQPYLAASAAEVVLVDNASRDETSLLLERLRGATVIRNRANAGFPAAVNQAAATATGEFLVFLNNDTELLGDGLTTASRFLDDNPDAGAAGGRLILLDGSLQEAGCTLWREGHVFQYGRGDDPAAPEYQFQRDVDYCSASFLMTRRELFTGLGGLDEAFSPGYFEDVDYCIRLWRSGWRVVYLPAIAVRHYENASSPCRTELLALYRRNHAYFVQKHADWLCGKGAAATTPPLWARSSHDDRLKVLYLPARSSTAIAGVVRQLHARHCFVTTYPIDVEGTTAALPCGELPAEVEVLAGGGLETLPRFLAERRFFYDGIVADDPAIIEAVNRERTHL